MFSSPEVVFGNDELRVQVFNGTKWKLMKRFAKFINVMNIFLMLTKLFSYPYNGMYSHIIIVSISKCKFSLFLYIILFVFWYAKPEFDALRCMYVEFLIIWSRLSFDICFYVVSVVFFCFFFNTATKEGFPILILNYCTGFPGQNEKKNSVLFHTT